MVGQLRERITDAEVDEMVDNPDDYFLSHATCALLVHYNNSTFQQMGAEKSKRYPMLDVYVIARSIRGPQGALAYMSRAQAALSGFRPAAGYCGRLFPMSDRFVSVSKDQWQYVVTFQLIGIYPNMSHMEIPDLPSTNPDSNPTS